MKNMRAVTEMRDLIDYMIDSGFNFNFINDTDEDTKVFEVQMEFDGLWIAINNAPVYDDDIDDCDMMLRVMHIVPNKDIFLGREVVSIIAEFNHAEDLLIYLKGMRRK